LAFSPFEVDELIGALTIAFEAARDPARAAGAAAYLRNQFSFFGINGEGRAAIERSMTAAFPRARAVEDVEAVALRCWDMPEREYQYFGVAYLRRHLPVFNPRLMPTVQRLISTKSWWDTVDDLATHVVGPLVSRHPELRSTMNVWIASENIWLARTAILHQERYKERTDPDLLFTYCLRRAGDRDFFLRKAIGWALRSYAKTSPSAVEAFLRSHGEALSGLSRREAQKGIVIGDARIRTRHASPLR
jgi:3-methyladenine DNA glycosylase AlkD